MTDLQTTLGLTTPMGSPTSPTHADAHNRLHLIANGIRNAKVYGALGDGATDDSAAIQAAIDACVTAGGGGVYCPRGTYKCATSLAIPNTVSVIFYGEGWGSIITGAANPLIRVTGGTNTNIRSKLVNLQVLVAGAQTGVFFDGVWNAAGNSGLAIEDCLVLGAGTSTQVLVNYTGMQATTVIRDSSIKNVDSGNDCTAILFDGATSAVMGPTIEHCTILAKRGINCNGGNVAPHDVESITVCGGTIINCVSYGFRAKYTLDTKLSDVTFTGGGTAFSLDGYNNTFQAANVYMDVGVAAPMVSMTTIAAGSSTNIKFIGCHFQGNGLGNNGIVLDTLGNGIYQLQVIGCDFQNVLSAMDFSSGVAAGELAMATIVGNTVLTATNGVVMGSSSSKRVNNTVTGNTFGLVTNPYTGQRIGSVVNSNVGDAEWQTWVPTLTANSGTFTSASAAGRWKQIDLKTYAIAIDVTCTTIGSASGFFILTLPSGMTIGTGNAVGVGINGSTGVLIRAFGAAGGTTLNCLAADLSALGIGSGQVVKGINLVLELA